MIKRPDSWLRFAFALAVFWAILAFTDLFLTDVAAFNLSINSVVVRQGYITALRGFFLALVLVLTLVITALMRRGLIIAPLVWVLQLARVALTGPWRDMFKNLLFVSEILNLFVFMLAPVILALLLWQGLERLDAEMSLGLLVPSQWLLLTSMVSAGNMFVWNWSQKFSLDLWPTGYGIIILISGFVLLGVWAGVRPWASIGMFFAGLVLPSIAYMVIWGGYDGLSLALLSLLPWGRGEVVQIWLELMALTAFPLLLATGVNQALRWRRGDKLLEIL